MVQPCCARCCWAAAGAPPLRRQKAPPRQTRLPGSSCCTLTESGSSTELCLVYPALSAMPVVGPVTRGQDLYWRLLSGQQVLPIQCGSSAYAKRYLEYYNLRAVDAQEVGCNAFVSTGYSWNSTPLWRTSGKAVSSVLDSLSISAAVNQNAAGSESETAGVLPALLPQRDTGHLPDANAADAVNVTVNFQSGGATGFVYDDALAAYGMLHADGTPQLDANTGTQAAFDNLLILYSGSSLRDDGRTLDYDLSMGGGIWLNGGHLWQITWTQGTQSTLALYDSNGKPLELPAGRSYIALLSSLTGQELLVQNSTGFTITNPEPGYYMVEAPWFPKVLKGIDVEDYEALQYMQRVLEKSGVFEALRQRGIQEGDIVSLYDIEFEYIP